MKRPSRQGLASIYLQHQRFVHGKLFTVKNGRVHTEQAHDERPIAKLLNGVWKNKDGPGGIQVPTAGVDDTIVWPYDYN